MVSVSRAGVASTTGIFLFVRMWGEREPMARRSFHVIDITEILIHWYAGRSQYELADSLGVDRKTIRKYLAPAVAAGMAPGGPPVSEADWAVLVRSWFPQLAALARRRLAGCWHTHGRQAGSLPVSREGAGYWHHAGCGHFPGRVVQVPVHVE
jgi:hypothetical protein